MIDLPANKEVKQYIDSNFFQAMHRSTFKGSDCFKGWLDKMYNSGHTGLSDSVLSAIRYRSKPCAGGGHEKAEPVTTIGSNFKECKETFCEGQLHTFTEAPGMANQTAQFKTSTALEIPCFYQGFDRPTTSKSNEREPSLHSNF